MSDDPSMEELQLRGLISFLDDAQKQKLEELAEQIREVVKEEKELGTMAMTLVTLELYRELSD